jgi:23S rRNA pseudouridine1911/1915/1917 synthase
MSEKQLDDDVDPDVASTLTFRVEPQQAGERLDRFLAACCQEQEAVPGEVVLSRARLQALIKAGDVARVGGGPIDTANFKVKAGEVYEIQLPPPVDAEPRGEAIPLDIVYEDRDLIVVNKPAGLVVHPAAGHAVGTLVNALIGHCGETLSGIGGVRRPGIVHRLDKDTSGLLVVAKTDAAHQGLSAQFQSHGVDGKLVRRYLALVWGAPERPKGKIETSLGRSGANRTKIAVVSADAGRHAVTHYERIAVYGDPPQASLMSLVLETGRTHQIRVHLAHLGHPVMGDPVYSLSHLSSARKLTDGARDALAALGRQALHATELGFEHPRTGKVLHFERPPPADMLDLIKNLRALSAGKRSTRSLSKTK